MNPSAAMLFTAGFGTRMGSLTQDRPKPLIEVGGHTLLDHALAVLDGAGIRDVVANLHYLPDQIVRHLSMRPGIRFSDETPLILETGGGLLNALPLLGEGPVFTLNTDAVWTGANPIEELRTAWRPDPMDGLLLLVPREAATGHTGAGDFDLCADGRIRRGRGFVYTGAGIVKTDGLGRVGEAGLLAEPALERDGGGRAALRHRPCRRLVRRGSAGVDSAGRGALAGERA